MHLVQQPVRVLLAAALVTGGAFAIARADRPHHTPPPEAFAACKSSKAGDTCSVTLHDHTMSGTCEAPPDNTELACRPDHPPGPPPEAIEACKASEAGDACSVTFGDQTRTGTCDAGPNGDGPLACHPAGNQD